MLSLIDPPIELYNSNINEYNLYLSNMNKYMINENDLFDFNTSWKNHINDASNYAMYYENKPFWNSSFSNSTHENNDIFNIYKIKEYVYKHPPYNAQGRSPNRVFVTNKHILLSEADVVILSFPLNGSSIVASLLKEQFGQDFRNIATKISTIRNIGDYASANYGSKKLFIIINRTSDSSEDYSDENTRLRSIRQLQEYFSLISNLIYNDNLDIGVIKNDFIQGKYSSSEDKEKMFEHVISLLENNFSNGIRNILLCNV